MSPEKAQYVQVKKETPSKKAEYAKPQNWGAPANKMRATTGVWRK